MTISHFMIELFICQAQNFCRAYPLGRKLYYCGLNKLFFFLGVYFVSIGESGIHMEENDHFRLFE